MLPIAAFGSPSFAHVPDPPCAALPTAHVNLPGHAATWQAEISTLPSCPSHFGAAAGHDDGAVRYHWLAALLLAVVTPAAAPTLSCRHWSDDCSS